MLLVAPTAVPKWRRKISTCRLKREDPEPKSWAGFSRTPGKCHQSLLIWFLFCVRATAGKLGDAASCRAVQESQSALLGHSTRGLRVGANMLQSSLAGQQCTRGLGAQLPHSSVSPREVHGPSHLWTLEDSSSERRFWNQNSLRYHWKPQFTFGDWVRPREWAVTITWWPLKAQVTQVLGHFVTGPGWGWGIIFRWTLSKVISKIWQQTVGVFPFSLKSL